MSYSFEHDSPSRTTKEYAIYIHRKDTDSYIATVIRLDKSRYSGNIEDVLAWKVGLYFPGWELVEFHCLTII